MEKRHQSQPLCGIIWKHDLRTGSQGFPSRIKLQWSTVVAGLIMCVLFLVLFPISFTFQINCLQETLASGLSLGNTNSDRNQLSKLFFYNVNTSQFNTFITRMLWQNNLFGEWISEICLEWERESERESERAPRCFSEFKKIRLFLAQPFLRYKGCCELIIEVSDMGTCTKP